MSILRKHYDSITDFKEALKRPITPMFMNRSDGLASEQKREGNWAGTNTMQEALKLLEVGDTVTAKKIEDKIKVMLTNVAHKTQRKQEYNVMGYQASVPRYLQGIPTNMINSKNVVVKQKVITITKSIGYSFFVTGDKLIEESIKAFEVIAKIEAQGMRCNLDLIEIAACNQQTLVTTIRIKHAGERLNVAKMAFCIANPAMSRRLMFRHSETDPDITDKSVTVAYGSMKNKVEDIKAVLTDKTHIIPGFIEDVDKLILSFKL